MARPVIVWYVSAHGFGHATRVCAVLEELPREIDVEVVTTAPRWVFACSLSRPFTYRELFHDPGLIQLDSVVFDPQATAAVWGDLLAQYPRLADIEAQRYDHRALLIAGDISPLAVLVAERLGVPSVCLANFTWDWILKPSAADFRALEEIRLRLADIYSRYDLLLRTPFHGDLSIFPRVCDVPLVVRQPTLSRQEARKFFGLPAELPVVLLSFGGHDQSGIRPEVLRQYPDLLFVRMRGDFRAPNLRVFQREVFHPNLVAASDVIFCKLGYGIVGEALACGNALLHLERHGFPETPIFEENLPRYLHICKILRSDFERGHWDALYDLLGRCREGPRLEPYTAIDGASRVAQILARLAEHPQGPLDSTS